MQTHQLQEVTRETDSTGYSQRTDGNTYSESLSTPADSQRSSRQGKNMPREDITLLYRSSWFKVSRLGVFSLEVARSTIFDEDGHPTSVYHLEMQLLPSICWFTTGCSIAYQSFTDRRGKPKMVLQPEVFRILGLDHDVWRVIREGDNMSLREMLATRLISPSDRDYLGRTLLHVIKIPLRNM